jgi:hypothetical protein
MVSMWRVSGPGPFTWLAAPADIGTVDDGPAPAPAPPVLPPPSPPPPVLGGASSLSVEGRPLYALAGVFASNMASR